MRRIERTTRSKRDYKREGKGIHRTTLQADLRWVLTALARDEVLPDRYRDHARTGDWSDQRDCHIKPDLILIYRKPDAETLQLVHCPARFPRRTRVLIRHELQLPPGSSPAPVPISAAASVGGKFGSFGALRYRLSSRKEGLAEACA
jgi:mRNA interferase YafQ